MCMYVGHQPFHAKLVQYFISNVNTVKIPKISPRAYIFQRTFLRGLYSEGLIIGGKSYWREICVGNISVCK